MVFGNVVGITHDAFVDLNQAGDFHFESGLFADFTMQRLFQSFAYFDDTARQRPPVLEGLFAALDEEDAVTFDDECSDAQNRTLGILAANTATLP